MNILIVSENFLKGGLETQIDTTVKTLDEKCNFFFAVSNYDKSWDLKNICTDFTFSYNSTVSEFCTDVTNLIKIIEKNNIDVIHVHPFYSIFPAIFAAKICNKPIVYTYHGISSFSFPYTRNDLVLFNMLLDYETDKIFCVSKEGQQIIENILIEKDKCIFLPNSINIQKFSETKINNNKHWALISRLDIDKINEINILLNNIQNLDIEELHIYGDGTEKQNLINYINENNLNNKVFFEGFNDNLSIELKDKYNGIIGIGRSAMEGIAMNYPVIIIGYDKISGIVDDELYSKLKVQNFSNKCLPSISINKLAEQLQNLYNNNYNNTFYSIFKNEFYAKTISDKYYNELNLITSSTTLNLKKIYEDLNEINKEDLFYSSINVYNTLKKYFLRFCRLTSQKNIFITQDQIIKQDNINNELNNTLLNQENLNAQIFNALKEHEEKISSLSQNTMTLSNLKRKIKYKFKH